MVNIKSFFTPQLWWWEQVTTKLFKPLSNPGVFSHVFGLMHCMFFYIFLSAGELPSCNHYVSGMKYSQSYHYYYYYQIIVITYLSMSCDVLLGGETGRVDLSLGELSPWRNCCLHLADVRLLSFDAVGCG